jgi:hypothetical protein
MHGIAGASYASLLGLMICLAPMVAGVWFAISPNERLLALMRPLTLAALFSAACGVALALTSGFRFLADANALDQDRLIVAAAVMNEGLAPVAASFACLAVGWVCVAIGMRRG